MGRKRKTLTDMPVLFPKEIERKGKDRRGYGV